uniref:DUF4219 domain-containing protein n=1 Tax=Peronospora matthiolae TaxID=2874970 RepID=A0AAV1TD19_9STRA
MWKFKMQMVLEDRDLWDVMNNDFNPALSYVQGPSDVQQKARNAFAIICLAMEDLQLPLEQSLLGAFEAWTALMTHSENKTQVQTLAEQVDAVGAPVSDEYLVITLLSSLNDSFQLLITALEYGSDEITRKLVTSFLLDEDLTQRSRTTACVRPK